MERTRDGIVRLLHERGEASVAELAEAIGVSSGSIRRHMDIMVAEQLLKSRLERQPRGRPVTRSSLSEAGQDPSAADHYSRPLARPYPRLAGPPAGPASRPAGGLGQSATAPNAPGQTGPSIPWGTSELVRSASSSVARRMAARIMIPPIVGTLFLSRVSSLSEA